MLIIYNSDLLQFSTAIHSILSFPGKPSIIVFENGYSENIDVSLTKRKEEKPNLLSTGETLQSSFLEYINEDHALLILCTSSNKVCVSFNFQQ